jgi:Flp pilus assembly protein TadG
MAGIDMSNRKHRRRRESERGAALVEFALCVALLLTLLFGIISYGYTLSFKQGLTQAAAEGARAGAVAASGSETSAATAAVARSVGAFNKTCNATPSVGLSCTYTVSATSPKTVTVQLTYDYKNYPLLPRFPGLGLLLPDTLKSTYVAEVN